MPSANRGLATELLDERHRRGLSQKGAGKEMKVSQGTVSKWEKGRDDKPAPENIPAVAKFLHRTPAEVEEMLEGPGPDRITEVGDQLHLLIDELIRLVRDGDS
jgi:transcriptional regulator with XRE-family HTH domain